MPLFYPAKRSIHTGFLAGTWNDTFSSVMLNEVKHPCAGFLADARNDIFGLVMLNEVKHPCAGFLAGTWND